MSQSFNSNSAGDSVPMLGQDKKTEIGEQQQEKFSSQLKQPQSRPQQLSSSSSLSITEKQCSNNSNSSSSSNSYKTSSCIKQAENQMSGESNKDKNQQNASKLAIEAAAAEASVNNVQITSSMLSSSGNTNQKQTQTNVQKQDMPINNDPNTISTSSPGESSPVASGGAAGVAGQATGPGDGEKTPVKRFSEKSLEELADLYLNFKPSEIPDSGFVVSGIAGRFPNADNLNELWDNLYNAKDMVLGPDDKRWPLGECL